ncbi:MAG: hypothetical protein ACPHCN_14390, partial [Mycobacterium sp.]
PAGARFWMTAASETREELPCVIDDGAPLVAQWRGPERAEYSAWVHDIKYSGRLKTYAGALGVKARLNTMMAVVDIPTVGKWTKDYDKPTQLAWNLTRAATGDSGGFGACIGDQGSAKDDVDGHTVSYASHQRNGPLMTLPIGDSHMGAASSGKMPAGPLALSMSSLFSDGTRTGPLEVKDDYPYPVVSHGVATEVNFVWDKDDNHAWIDPMGVPRFAKGRWKWHSWSMFQPPITPPPPTGGPPQQPVNRNPPPRRGDPPQTPRQPPAKPPVTGGGSGRANQAPVPKTPTGPGQGVAKIVESDGAEIKRQQARVKAAKEAAARKERFRKLLEQEKRRLREAEQRAKDKKKDLTWRQIEIKILLLREKLRAAEAARKAAAEAANRAVSSGAGSAAAGSWSTSTPALTTVALAAPAMVGIPAASPGDRFVSIGAVAQSQMAPSVWAANTVAQHARRNATGARTWIRDDRGPHSPPNGTAKGGLAFAPASRDADPDVLPAATAAATAAQDVHLAATAGAGLAVAAEIDPTTGRVVDGLRIRRDASGEVVMSMVGSDGTDDVGNPALVVNAFTTFEGGVNLPVDAVQNTSTMDRSQTVMLVDTNSGNVTTTMPPANECTRMVFIKNGGSSGNTAIISADGSDTFDDNGTGSVNLADGEARIYVSDGSSEWLRFSVI